MTDAQPHDPTDPTGGPTHPADADAGRPARGRAQDHTAAVERALAALDLDTKAGLLSGQDMWTLPAVPAIGLRSLVMSDGPVGVRGQEWNAEDPSVALPSPTALAATWDPGLARRAGHLLAQEARRKGVHVLLAPTVNLHRSPLGGRHFECYAEDPLLTGAIGAGYVRGVQEGGVGRPSSTSWAMTPRPTGSPSTTASRPARCASSISRPSSTSSKTPAPGP